MFTFAVISSGCVRLKNPVVNPLTPLKVLELILQIKNIQGVPTKNKNQNFESNYFKNE